MRAERGARVAGLPPFAIKPPGERDEYVVLNYIEPMGKNVAAWGLDLLGDPARRNIVDRARDTGGAAAGSGVILLRDGSASVSSTLMRLAVYRGGGVPPSLEERRRRFAGVAGSTLRIGEMVEATLTRDTLAELRVCVFDDGSQKTLLYDSRPAAGPARAGSYAFYAVSLRIPVADQAWRIEMTPLVDPVAWLDRSLAAGVFMVGLMASLLLFWLLRSIAIIELRGFELAQRSRQATLLTTLGEDLHACLTTAEAHAALVGRMPELLPDTSAVLYVFDASRSRATAAARWGAPQAAAEVFAPQECQGIRRGQPYLVEDATTALTCGHFAGASPHCYVCLPLTAQGESVGLLHIQRAPGATAWEEAGMNLVRAAAQHLALALANLGLREKLLERATRDSLTGLYNRHYMSEWFEQELHRAARHGRRVGVVMIDIDHFKKVNDTFGHEAGDMVLRELAAAMRRLARKSDVACRHGGEEFLLLMPETDPKGALAKAEELRREVEQLDLAYAGEPLGRLTISAGVAIYPQDGGDADTLLRRADDALYAAKENGRNRVVVAGPVREANAA